MNYRPLWKLVENQDMWKTLGEYKEHVREMASKFFSERESLCFIEYVHEVDGVFYRGVFEDGYGVEWFKTYEGETKSSGKQKLERMAVNRLYGQISDLRQGGDIQAVSTMSLREDSESNFKPEYYHYLFFALDDIAGAGSYQVIRVRVNSNPEVEKLIREIQATSGIQYS